VAYLRESLGSARGQTYRDLEILVSDDGSSDGTADYVRGVQAEDPRVRLLPRNPRPGLFTNINYLLSQSEGDAFCILGDDDRLLSEFVERLAEPLRKEEVIASFSDHWVIDPAGQVQVAASEENSRNYGRTSLAPGPLEDPVASVLRGSMCMGFSLYRASAFRDEPFDLECGGAADFDYAIRASQLGVLYYVAERLGEYRSHPGTATGTRPRFMIDGAIHAFQKHAFASPRHEQLRRAMLRDRYRARIGYLCTEDRIEWARAVGEYLRLGGKPFDLKVVGSFGAAAVPHSLGRWLKTRARRARASRSPIPSAGASESRLTAGSRRG
jgi:glycosyltransferase involved in cell wall biosynthesis